MRMIRVLIYIALCVLIGIGIAQDPGYVFIAYQHWTLEMPLWLGLGLMIISTYLLYVLIQLIDTVGRTPGAIKAWFRGRRKV